MKKIGYVLLGAIGMVNEHRAALAKALALPFALFLLLDIIRIWQPSQLVFMLTGFAGLLVQAVFAVTTHRIVMLGAGSVPEWGIRSWSARETQFVINGMILGLMMLPVALLGLIPAFGLPLMLTVMAWLIGRLSLVFPAIATDKPINFQESWRLTGRHQGLMVLVVVVIPVFLVFPVVLLGQAVEVPLVAGMVSLLATVFVVAALSVAYRVVLADRE